MNKLIKSFRDQTKYVKFVDYLNTLTLEEIQKLARESVTCDLCDKPCGNDWCITYDKERENYERSL